MANQGTQMVIERNNFYRDGYRRMALAVVLIFFINIGVGCLIAYQWFHPPQPQYFATTPSGRIIIIHPLSDPTVSNDYVTQFAVKAVTAAFSLDYVHWKAQLQTASNNFTGSGWRYFLGALKSTNNLNTLINLKMVSNATVTGSPQIINQMVLPSGVYGWYVKIPMLITYYSATRTNITMPMNISLLIVRVKVQTDPDRVAVNNFFASNVNVNALQNAVKGL